VNKSSGSLSGWLSALAIASQLSVLGAIDLDLSASDIDAALQVARGPESGRALFHGPYVFDDVSPLVERIEVISEIRRVVLMAETRIAAGDRMFAQSTSSAEAALRPFRQRVSIVATLRFPNQNSYVLSPPLDIALQGSAGDVPRIDLKSETIFGRGGANQQLPVVGGVVEVIFDAGVIAEVARLAIVRMDGKEVGGITIDFSRLD
jgi:hypothetical protein